MAGRSIQTRHSVREWCVRGLSAAAVAGLGYFGVAESLASGLRRGDAQRAYAWAPWDGRLSAALAQTINGPDAAPTTRARADQLARTALRQDPTAVVAAATLGINTHIRGDSRGAQRLINYAQTLSRRDLASQIWLIENSVANGDVSQALRHYDIALRTSPKSMELLFPILAGALAEPDVRRALTRTLATRPPWSALFVEYVSANGPDPRATAMLFRDADRAGYSVSGLSRMLLTDTLASRGLFGDAWSLYASFRRDADRRSSRDPAFLAELSNPTVFDWRPVNDAGISASLPRGALEFAVPSSVGGTLAEQTQLLPPGDYRIEGRSNGIDQAQGSSPYWRLTCNDGREIGRVEVPNSASASGAFSGRFIVPAGCLAQTLALVAKPSEAVSGVTGRIENVRLFPARGENGR